MKLLLGLIAALFIVLISALVVFAYRRNLHRWIISYIRQDWREAAPAGVKRHLLFCFVDHFEPNWARPTIEVERERVALWSKFYPELCANRRDADGRSPVHTFFYPAEEYRREHLDVLVDLCRKGLGEIEIHLHHDSDTESGLRETLRTFIGQLVDNHDALPLDASTGKAQWSFIHGSWALDNSHPQGLYCGVNDELRILREEGCYADFTLPSAPDPCQTATINKIYYAKSTGRPRSHESGRTVEVGGAPWGDLMLIPGPLGFMKQNRKYGILPRIENSDVRALQPAEPWRIDAWVRTGIHVVGRPEWIFVKVHTHGVQERDSPALLGEPMKRAFDYLESEYNDGDAWALHYVSAREMYNIAKAAEAGLSGDPGLYRDYVIGRPGFAAR